MKILRITLMFCLTWMAYSCSPLAYSTTGQIVPLFKKEGEVMTSVNFSLTEDTKGFNIQAAEALPENWAIALGATALHSSDEQGWKGHGTFFELGAGKSARFQNDRIALELLGGIGLGTIQNKTSQEFVNLHFVKPFIQPSIGICTQNFAIAFTPRMGSISYFDYHIQRVQPKATLQWQNFFEKQKNIFVFEPGVTIRGGSDIVKLQVQGNISTFSYDQYDDVSYNTLYLSIGLFYVFQTR